MAATAEKTEKARQHIDQIRKTKFSIGEKRPNPLTEDLQNAVTNLSSELYTKDAHFLMEIIQNAEDNEYLAGVTPTLEFVITCEDVAGVGAAATLLVFNNEVGFSKTNIESICSIGRSTKKGRRNQGYIGEKGIGFKSVFLVSAWPHIFSNGYQIRFSEVPNQDCGIGYIVPEWIATKPSLSDLKVIYGSSKVLPATIIILPIKSEKVEAIKKELSQIQPEVLLFLHKIKKLSARQIISNSCLEDSVSVVSITSETNPIPLRSQEADCRVVHLSYQQKSGIPAYSCCYYIWKQALPVKASDLVGSRKDVKEWVISLAFPVGKRSGTSAVGIFAFLPTAMVTNFPFIVQADFILASSRETICLDSKWNLGILNHVPSSFLSALSTCLKSTETAQVFSVPQVLSFLPVQESPYKVLNVMRQTIKALLKQKRVVPCESFSNNKISFCKPTDAIRVSQDFRNILLGILDSGAPMRGIPSERKFVLHNSVDFKISDQVWHFLEVPSVRDCKEWYAKCIQACSLVSRGSTDMYVELLAFLADNWYSMPFLTVSGITLVKYITYNREMRACSLSQITREKLGILVVWDVEIHEWLSKWNLEMGCPGDMFFLPNAVVTALMGHGRRHLLKEWLRSKVNVLVTDVFGYCMKVSSFLRTAEDPKLAVMCSHLIYHSAMKNYIRVDEISKILCYLPVVDTYGNVVQCEQALVPATGSKWAELFSSDHPHEEEDGDGKYVILGEVYDDTNEFAGECMPKKKMTEFFRKHFKTVDLPDIFPKKGALRVASSELNNDQALLLLEWIRMLRAKKYGLPVKFIGSIKTGKWMKTYSGFDCPIRCFLSDGTEQSILLEIGKKFKVLSAIDEIYYKEQIRSFKDELMFIGVQLKSEDLYQLVADHLKYLAASEMSKEDVILLISFLKYSKTNNKLDVNLLKYLQGRKWLKTLKGYMTPAGSIFLLSDHAEALLDIADLQVVDNTYYGSELGWFVDELKSLGVLVVMELEDVYKLLSENFRIPEDLSTMKKRSIFLLLGCIRHLGPTPTATSLTQKIRCKPWMKTTCGLTCPSETLLCDKKWGHLLNVVPLPFIDVTYYGSRIRWFKGELEAMGVIVDLDGACKMLAAKFKLLASSSKLTSANVISFLNCLKYTSKAMPSLLFDMRSFLWEEKWLKTTQGYKSSPDSILANQEWEAVSKFVELPLIDEVFYGIGMKSFKDELEMLGVVVSLSEGAHFVAKDVELPKETETITPEFALILLQCTAFLQKSTKKTDESLLEYFHIKLKGSRWLKTHMGYKSVEQCLLFNPDWEGQLKEYDAPFVDQSFYGPLGPLEKDALKLIGVQAELGEVCSAIFHTLNLHTKTPSIMRIYRFLIKSEWSPKQVDLSSSELWIPYQNSHQGKWVLAQKCVLCDRGSLLKSHFYALDEYYNWEFLFFFNKVFGVAWAPSRDDYVKLWNEWERSNHQPSCMELNSFWGYISEKWDTVMECVFDRDIIMLPATANDGTIQLVKKEEVFISDDLQLKRSFAKVSQRPLFVWLPQNGLSSVTLTKLYKIYRKIGVRRISESVQFSTSTLLGNCKLEKMEMKDGLIGKTLIKIVLCFLASTLGNIPTAERHKAAKSLLDISVFGTADLLMVDYDLSLPLLKKTLGVQIRRMVLWEKNSRTLFVDKPSLEDGRKSIEFVTDFARAISEVVLPNVDLMDILCGIIKMAFEYGFREDDVNFMLVTEHLNLHIEDKEFLDIAFPPIKSPKRSDSLIFARASKRRSIELG